MLHEGHLSTCVVIVNVSLQLTHSTKGTKNIKYYVKDFENSLIEL